jgi:hypothetical protein
MQLAQKAIRDREGFQSEQAGYRGGRRATMATQTSTLKVKGCKVETQAITIFFSGPVDQSSTTDPHSATNPNNYTVFAPNSGFVNAHPSDWKFTPLPDKQTIVITASKPTLQAGDWVQITVDGVTSSDGDSTIDSEHNKAFGQVASIAVRQARDVEDAISYPVLTEEVSYRPSSPVGIPTTGAGGIAGPGASNIGQIAMQAVTDVLGWKVNSADPKGFLGALTQSFSLKDVEGHVESAWVPRTYAVQTDLGGGITGAQASLYMRAKDALDQSLSLLDGLYPLDPDADPEYVRALREMARSQMNEIVKEFGVVGLPSILRINTYFEILLGQDIKNLPTSGVQLDPDQVGGTLGKIRKIYGIYFEGNPFNNSVEDEQDITNFRVISDYMTSLCQSWIENRRFFKVESKQPAFFGTQLVLISRQFNVISETVNEVRFALDSVFIGPNERQTLLLKFPDSSKFPSMYLEDVLDEVDSFVSDEGPRLLRDGGKISVTNNIFPVVKELKEMIWQTRNQTDKDVPKGFTTARVRRAMDDLHGQLDQLLKLTKQVEQKLPIPLYALTIQDILGSASSSTGDAYTITLSIIGSAIDPRAQVTFESGTAVIFPTVFFSAERIDASFDTNDPDALDNAQHTVTITNPNGELATATFTYDWDSTNQTLTVTPSCDNGGNGGGGADQSADSQYVRVTEKVYRSSKSAKTPPKAASEQVSQQIQDSQDKNDALRKELSDLRAELSAKIDVLKSTQENVQKALAGSAPPSQGTAAPTKEELAEALKTHHPSLWESIKDEFSK